MFTRTSAAPVHTRSEGDLCDAVSALQNMDLTGTAANARQSLVFMFESNLYSDDTRFSSRELRAGLANLMDHLSANRHKLTLAQVADLIPADHRVLN